jgi:alkaline phosphatase D
MKRRDFLRATGTFFATAALGGLTACGGDDAPGPDGSVGPAAGTYLFPQGLASADPRETSVVLWTRAVLASGAADAVSLHVEVATDAQFATVVISQMIDATAANDHTVRVVIDGLAADTAYHYRFTAGQDVVTGRTRTAPAANADVPVRLAWLSCQDYSAGTYAVYRQLLIEDEARAEADQIRFVLHLGDFIYETRGDYFQKPLNENLEPITLNNADGTPREVAAFPSGGGTINGSNFARTVDDYRHLYKTIASDPDLRAARARWPFIHTWDDHEFTNDCWQSQANYTDANGLDEGSQARKLAANQAWSEYVPAHLTGATGVSGVTQHAHDFAAATVADAMFTAANNDNFVDEPNNAAAVGSITIYRSLRFGRHVELVVTDERSYRSDHAIPEELAASSFEYLDPRNVLPAADLDVMDAGKTANNNNPPAKVGFDLPNPRITSPAGTMLGATQKAWWKDTMHGSDATWKVWGNEVPLMRFFLPKGPVDGLIVDRTMDGDAWDGYASERKELTTYLRTMNVQNLLVLSGDIHAHFAGVVHDDYLAGTPMPVGVELCAAGVSSNSLFSFYEFASRGSGIPADVRGVVTYSASADGGSPFVENLNMLILHGAASAKKMFETNRLDMALLESAPPNPHVKYADSNSQGFGVALITATQVVGTLTTMARPVTTGAPVVKRAATFTIPKDNPGGMTGPTITGTKPFPFT